MCFDRLAFKQVDLGFDFHITEDFGHGRLVFEPVDLGCHFHLTKILVVVDWHLNRSI